MSTIRADYISPSAGGTSKSLVRGTAAAWVNFDGTGTIAARDSENVSSLTDNGTGVYTANLSSAFDSTNNVAQYMGTNIPMGTGFLPSAICPSASGVQVIASNPVSLATQDAENSMLSAHGDLA